MVYNATTMTDAFDPYSTWLDIPMAEQPPHCYRLLGLPVFCDDVALIAESADAQMAKVRGHHLGGRAEHSQRLLTELAQAKRCLLDTAARQRYDVQLRDWLAAPAAAAASPAPPPIIESPTAAIASGPPPPPRIASTDSISVPPLKTTELPTIATAAASDLALHASRPRGKYRLVGPIFWTAACFGLLGMLFYLVSNWTRANRNDGAIVNAAANTETELEAPQARAALQPTPPAALSEGVVAQAADGSVTLSAAQESLRGDTAVTWQVHLYQPGFFEPTVEFSIAGPAQQGGLQMEFADRTLSASFGSGPTTVQFKTVLVRESGEYTVSLRLAETDPATTVDVLQVRLKRIAAGSFTPGGQTP